MSKFSGFVGGLGEGYSTTQKLILDRQRNDREAQAADQQAQMRQQEIDKNNSLQDAYKDIAAEAVKISGVQIPQGQDTGEPGVPPKEVSPQQALGFALHQQPDLLKNRDFLNRAAGAFLSRGLPDGVKWLEAGHKASSEGYTQALQALMNGDPGPSRTAFQRVGQIQGRPVEDCTCRG